MSDEMKRELNAVKTRLDRVELGMEDLKTLSRRTMIAVAKMTGDIAEMKSAMATKDDISGLNRRMDGFVSRLEARRA